MSPRAPSTGESIFGFEKRDASARITAASSGQPAGKNVYRVTPFAFAACATESTSPRALNSRASDGISP